MLLLSYPLAALAIGFIAQSYFNRTGLWWGIATLAVGAVFAMFLDNAITSDPKWVFDSEYRKRASDPGHEFAFVLMTAGPAFVVMLIALFSMPKVKGDIVISDPANDANSTIDALERLAVLRNSGALSADEFEAQKKAILEHTTK